MPLLARFSCTVTIVWSIIANVQSGIPRCSTVGQFPVCRWHLCGLDFAGDLPCLRWILTELQVIDNEILVNCRAIGLVWINFLWYLVFQCSIVCLPINQVHYARTSYLYAGDSFEVLWKFNSNSVLHCRFSAWYVLIIFFKLPPTLFQPLPSLPNLERSYSIIIIVCIISKSRYHTTVQKYMDKQTSSVHYEIYEVEIILSFLLQEITGISCCDACSPFNVPRESCLMTGLLWFV